MEVNLIRGFEEFEYQGETYQATSPGRREIELNDEGEKISVYYYGIDHTFPPPRANVEYIQPPGLVSSLGDALLSGSFVETDRVLKEIVSHVPTFTPPVARGAFNENRYAIASRFFQEYNLEQVAAQVDIPRIIMHNPSKSVMCMLKKFNQCDYDIVLHQPPDAPRAERVAFNVYRATVRDLMLNLHWRGALLAYEDIDPGAVFAFGGYSAQCHHLYEHFLTFELDPYAYIASGKVFSDVSYEEDGVHYGVYVSKGEAAYRRVGHYPSGGQYYRMTPDCVRKELATKDFTSWSMYGILTSVDFRFRSLIVREEDIDVVKSATIMDARGLRATNRQQAREEAVGLFRGPLDDRKRVMETLPKLSADTEAYKQARFYVFPYASFILDTGEKKMFRIREHGTLHAYGVRYEEVDDPGRANLVLSPSRVGRFRWGGRTWRLVWKSDGWLRMNLVPSPSLITYMSATRARGDNLLYPSRYGQDKKLLVLSDYI